MVKKKDNKIKIDFQKCILEDSLLQIKNQKALNVLALTKAWAIHIDPKDSPKVLSLLRELSINDCTPLNHLKRMQRTGEFLTVILCSEDHLNLEQITTTLENEQFTYNDLKLIEVTRHCPGTKELSIQWSNEYWPIIWKGNPNDQILNAVQLDINIVQDHMQRIAEISIESTSNDVNVPIVTSIVNPVTNEIVATSKDQRHVHPLSHSIMSCIELVSQNERRKKQELQGYETHYLCHGFHVYTTHEPCTMCSMALIHSRISRLIYLRQSPSTGALNPSSGDGYTIHDHDILNSNFEVWEWVGKPYQVGEVDHSINA